MIFWPIKTQLSAPPTYFSLPLHVCSIFSFWFNYILLNIHSSYPVISLSGPTHSSQTNIHTPLKSESNLPFDDWLCGCSLCVSVFMCLCKCVLLFLFLSVPGMWRFVWRVSHTLCYQHLCDEYKHSLRGLGVVSQMVQCQGPWVWFRRWWVALILPLPSPVTLLCQGAIFPHAG